MALVADSDEATPSSASMANTTAWFSEARVMAAVPEVAFDHCNSSEFTAMERAPDALVNATVIAETSSTAKAATPTACSRRRGGSL